MNRHKETISIFACAVALCLCAACSRSIDGSAELASGQKALEDGDYESAASHLKRAAKAFPDSPVLKYNLGMAEFRRGALNKAERAFFEADSLTIDGNTDALEALAAVYIQQGKPDRAMAMYSKSVEKMGFRHPRVLCGMAVAQLKLGLPEESLGLLSEAMETGMTYPLALYNTAVVLRDGFGDAGAAKAYFMRYIANAGDGDPAHLEKARRAVDVDMASVAEASTRNSTLILSQITPDMKPQQAIMIAERALHDDPWSQEAMAALAKAFIAKDPDSAEAKRVIAKLARHYPDNERLNELTRAIGGNSAMDQFKLGVAAFSRKDYDAAARHFTRGLSFDPSNRNGWTYLVATYDAAARYQDCADACSNALTRFPNNPEFLRSMGFAQFRLGDKAASKSTLERYLKAAPRNDANRAKVEAFIRGNLK